MPVSGAESALRNPGQVTVEGLMWVCVKSDSTGQVGPTPLVAKALEKANTSWSFFPDYWWPHRESRRKDVDGMVDDVFDVRVDSILGHLAQRFRRPGPRATASWWDSWIELEVMDSAIAGALTELKSSGHVVSTIVPDLPGWRAALSDDRRWAGRWEARRKLLVEACDLLIEAGARRKPR